MLFRQITPEELNKLAEKAYVSTRKWIVAFNKKQANKLDDVVHSIHEKAFEEEELKKTF